jgi:hypothetical protein
MKSKANFGKYSGQLLAQLDIANDNDFISAKQAAQLIGISLRTMRYREAEGKTPPRISGKGTALPYRLKDIKTYAKRSQQEEALRLLNYAPEDIDYVFTLQPSKRKTIFVQHGFHPSLWS